MINVSSGFKNSIKQLAVFSDGKVDVINSNGTLHFTSDEISKIEIYGSAYQNDKVLGNLAQHSLTLEILGDLTKSIPLTIENTLQAYIGVLVDDVYEYVQFQDFYATSVTYSDTTNVTKIIATDNIVKLNKEFVDSNTYPMSLKSYLESVLTYCGLQLENTSFFNDDFVIDAQPINSYTSARDIVSKVAEMALSYAIVNKVSNKIELRKAFDPFTRAYTHDELSSFTHEELSNLTHFDIQHAVGLDDESVSKQNYWSFKLSDNWFGTFGINTLTLKNSQVDGDSNTVLDNTYVDVDGNVELVISDNPFINTEDKRLNVIDDIFNEIVNYKYSPYTLEYRGFPYLEVGDIVDITNMEDNSFASPIYDYTIRYDGGLYGKIGAKALSKVETTYYNTQTLSNRVKHAEVVVDKVQGEVTIMAGDYYDGKLVGTYYNFDGDGFSMTNSSDEVVFYADSNGNLTLTGTIVGSTFIAGNNGDRFEFDETSLRSYKDDVKRVELDYDSMTFNDPNGNVTAYLFGKTFSTTSYFYISTDETLGDSGINSSKFTITNQFADISGNPSLIELEASNGNKTQRAVANGLAQDAYGTNVDNAVFRMYCYGSDGYTATSQVQTSTGTAMNVMSASSPTVSQSITLNTYSVDFYSSNQAYTIYIDGAYRTITRDSSGFLKAL